MPRTLVELTSEAAALRRAFPDGTASLKAGRLRWEGDLTPSQLSRTYRVIVTYDAIHQPRTRVVSPRLEPDENGELPHIYPSGDLCLYRAGEWTWGDRLADTIVPWACEWLLHYEIWKVGGGWQGSGGDHTGPIRQPTAQRRLESPRVNTRRGRRSGRR